MHASRCCDRVGSAHPPRIFLAGAVLAAILSVVLLGCGVAWWYAPLAVPAILLAHGAVLAGGLLVSRALRGHRAPGGAGHSHGEESDVLHRPRLYDWTVKALTLGQEERLRGWTLDLAGLGPGSAVLDVGSGTGSLLLAAAARVGPSGALHGVEPSPEMAARARRKAEALGVPLSIAEGSAAALPYPPGSFDAAFCSLVLHHLPPSMRDAAIGEIRGVLRPGGRVVLVDWERPRSIARALFSPIFLVYLLHNLRPGASPLDAPDLEARMRQLGFQDIARHSFGGGGVGAIVGRAGPGADISG